MKQILLWSIFILITTACFSQVSYSSESGWNNYQHFEKQNEPKLKIYPNPCTNGILSIEFENQQIKEIQITNIAGKHVMHKKYGYAESKKRLQLDNILNGMYLIRVKSIDNNVVIKKLIIAKE